jgi:hypothetical protein
LLMVLVPSAKQLAGVLLSVGTAGVANWAALLNEAEAAELQPPLVEVTVYEVPKVMPLINPPAPTVGPAGVNV